MRESVRLTEQTKTEDHEELLDCIEVLRPILDPAELQPYKAELWKRRNRV
jgi:hypothetical protein